MPWLVRQMRTAKAQAQTLQVLIQTCLRSLAQLSSLPPHGNEGACVRECV